MAEKWQGQVVALRVGERGDLWGGVDGIVICLTKEAMALLNAGGAVLMPFVGPQTVSVAIGAPGIPEEDLATALMFAEIDAEAVS